jgi:hypothetical protein
MANPPSHTRILVMFSAGFSLPHTISFTLNVTSVVVSPVSISLNVNAPRNTGRETMALVGEASAKAIMAVLVSSTLSLNSGDRSSFKLSL